jgi:hypothetical protein
MIVIALIEAALSNESVGKPGFAALCQHLRS